jgi:hypothetical protein
MMANSHDSTYYLVANWTKLGAFLYPFARTPPHDNELQIFEARSMYKWCFNNPMQPADKLQLQHVPGVASAGLLTTLPMHGGCFLPLRKFAKSRISTLQLFHTVVNAIIACIKLN